MKGEGENQQQRDLFHNLEDILNPAESLYKLPKKINLLAAGKLERAERIFCMLLFIDGTTIKTSTDNDLVIAAETKFII